MNWIRTAIASVAFLAPLGAPALADDRIVAYTIVDGRTVPDSLTGDPGDPEAGRKLYFDRDLTGCSGCHGSPGGPGAQPDANGAKAPELTGIGDRLDEGTIRMWLIAPQVLAPGSEMPGYYSVGQRDDENDPLYGSTRLSAEEIEALVAYLASQKSTQVQQ